MSSGGGGTCWNALSVLYPYRIHRNSFARYIFDKKHECILKVLKAQILDEWEDASCDVMLSPNNSDVEMNNTVWTFWWQGIGKMPKNAQNCISQMKKYAGKHPVVVITRNNWGDYIKIDQIVLDKLNDGKISIIHLSDIVRMKLLSMYGGLWLDAGIFPVRPIGEEWFENLYYTRKDVPHQEANISDSKWCGSVTSGHANFCFFRFMEFAFDRYWKIYNNLVDYFLIDILTRLAFDNITEFRDAVNEIPYNNPDLYLAERILNNNSSSDVITDIKNNNTFLRLQWRKQYAEFNENRPTIYNRLLCD